MAFGQTIHTFTANVWIMITLGTKRKLKGWALRIGIHHFINERAIAFLSSLTSLSAWVGKNKKHSFNDFPTSKVVYNKRFDLFSYIIESQNLINEPLEYFEFGVATGDSFRWWMNALKHPDSRFYGFDTFTGLPEAWGHFKKGDLSNGNEIPAIEGNRHQFFQGLFQQTLFPFVREHTFGKRKLIHLDADLFTSTYYVLNILGPYIQEGDILFFDEFNVPMHEFKAFKDWTEAHYIQYRVLGSVNNYYQTAIIIE